jgi:hypothetical protein
MHTPYIFYSDIELKKFKLKISKITIAISALWPHTVHEASLITFLSKEAYGETRHP